MADSPAAKDEPGHDRGGERSRPAPKPSKRKRKLAAALLGVLVAAVAVAYVIAVRRQNAAPVLTLYGNVDIREVRLAFNDSERVVRMLVQEGDRVRRGQLLAELEAVRYAAQVAQAQANLKAHRRVLERMLNGSRPEEIVQARSNAEALQGTLRDAEVTYRRDLELRREGVISQQTLDDAESRLKEARGNYQAARQAWILAVKGPRIEDIRNARAVLDADQAALKLAERELADTRLYAPADGVIENRILEPGDMAAPNVPVFTMALTDPVWVRAYVPEPLLGKINLGMHAAIATDSFPGKLYQGWIGYISPTAEFTPKNIETPELRTRLVYQVRVYACNFKDELRLGMPATVTIDLLQKVGGPQADSANPCGGATR